MDISFSGILTKVERIIKQWKAVDECSRPSSRDKKQPSPQANQSSCGIEPLTAADICHSLQEHIFAMLTEVTERAVAHTGANEILVVGGVGCNLRLQEMLQSMAVERGATMYGMDDRYCIDNGAMIAYTGLLHARCKQYTNFEDTIVTQRYRTDQFLICHITSMKPVFVFFSFSKNRCTRARIQS